jgi:hypothetical protein
VVTADGLDAVAVAEPLELEVELPFEAAVDGVLVTALTVAPELVFELANAGSLPDASWR